MINKLTNIELIIAEGIIYSVSEETAPTAFADIQTLIMYVANGRTKEYQDSYAVLVNRYVT